MSPTGLDTHPKTSKLYNIANVIDPAISNNPVLSAAIQVLDQISEVGKVLPFVAPVFVLLKIIIDLEKKATEVDEKSVDLLKRITFMGRHLLLLEDTTVTAFTVEVIDRMQGILKDCHALLDAYAKQGPVARRLRLSNRDKFTRCADDVNSCCQDLLISLQIHQAVKINILACAVPSDPVTRAYIDQNGGTEEAVVTRPELVRQFAEQQGLVMDDSVMEELRINISDTIKESHEHLDKVLSQNVDSYIVDGLKCLAERMLSLEAEQTFVCVQCEKNFTERTNGPQACSSHRSNHYALVRKIKIFDCCGESSPCQWWRHRAKHHSEYPYAAFFTRLRNLMTTTATTREWARVLDTNFENRSKSEHATVGRVNCWTPHGAWIHENTIYVMVGSVEVNKSYYFDTYTPTELQRINKYVRATLNTIIFRTSESDIEYSMAEWVVSREGDITGIRLRVKAATSTKAHESICHIDGKTCTQTGEVEVVSQGDLRSYTPAEDYSLPPPVRVGPDLNERPTRPVRTDFSTVTPDALPVIMEVVSNPPLSANVEYSTSASDSFQGIVSVFNNADEGSSKSIVISSASAMYRLIGDSKYSPVSKFILLDGLADSLPKPLRPLESLRIKFQADILRTEEDTALGVTWQGSAFVARYRPLRLKLIVRDMRGNQCSLVIDYVFQPRAFTFQKPYPGVTLLSFDDYIRFERRHLQLHNDIGDHWKQFIESHIVDIEVLNKVMYQAHQTKETEIKLWIHNTGSDGVWEYSVYALVDISCQCVYAFKILMHDVHKEQRNHFGALYYVPCPPYGNPSTEVRPIKYAKEVAELPDLEQYAVTDYPQDDDFDDIRSDSKTTVPPTEASTTSGSGVDAASIDEIKSRLASLETKLDGYMSLNTGQLLRIITALEKLTESSTSQGR